MVLMEVDIGQGGKMAKKFIFTKQMFPMVGCCTLSTISRQVLLLPFTAAEPFRVEKDKLSQKADLKGKKGILKERFFINSVKMAKYAKET